VIIAENQGYKHVIGNPNAPNINRLAATYGSATNFFGELHPSEGNYLAIIGGDTFGIRDDDAWYCKQGAADRHCSSADTADYVDHTLTARSLIDQLTERGLTWKGYFESIPSAGSKAIHYPDAQNPVAGLPNGLYAAKHNAFLNFKTVQDDLALPTKLVGFEQLALDLASGQVPSYAHIVPNQCNDMHGLSGPNVPTDCAKKNRNGLIVRGDKVIGQIVAMIQSSPIWSAQGNVAIIVTWDEANNSLLKFGAQGCCGADPASAANFGGGHIPTIVITNHGPRGVKDDTPYNHFSLLRTTEEAFGIGEYLGHANDAGAGVRAMTPLFEVSSQDRAERP
jgi:hypothetical protein